MEDGCVVADDRRRCIDPRSAGESPGTTPSLQAKLANPAKFCKNNGLSQPA